MRADAVNDALPGASVEAQLNCSNSSSVSRAERNGMERATLPLHKNSSAPT